MIFGVELRILMRPIMRGAVCSMKVNGTLTRQATTPATHDLCPEDSTQDGPQLATIAKRFSAMAHRVESLRCEGSDAIGAKRTCRERRERVDLKKMTQCGGKPARNPAVQRGP
jgi:hypothetical protein